MVSVRRYLDHIWLLQPLDGVEYYYGAHDLIFKGICYQRLDLALPRISLWVSFFMM